MIICHKHMLLQRAVERGYEIDDVMPCVVAQDGDQWTIDTEHPAYPKTFKHTTELPTAKTSAPSGGPGTELSKLLKRFGVEPTPTCPCREVALRMDVWGPDECSRPERMNAVLAAMRDEAKARGLLFLDAAGKLLIRRAIANARRTAASTT